MDWTTKETLRTALTCKRSSTPWSCRTASVTGYHCHSLCEVWGVHGFLGAVSPSFANTLVASSVAHASCWRSSAVGAVLKLSIPRINVPVSPINRSISACSRTCCSPAASAFPAAAVRAAPSFFCSA